MQMRPVDGRELAAGKDYQIDKDFAAIAEEIDSCSCSAGDLEPTEVGARGFGQHST